MHSCTLNLSCLEIGDDNFEDALWGPVYTYRLRLRVRHRLCQICIVYKVTVCLTIRMGPEPILSLKRSVSNDTVIDFNGDGDGHLDGDCTCKQVLRGKGHDQRQPEKILVIYPQWDIKYAS